jgi:hypothetical protein
MATDRVVPPSGGVAEDDNSSARSLTVRAAEVESISQVAFNDLHLCER